MRKIVKTQNYSDLITDLTSFIEHGRSAAVRYVNTVLVATYWLVGRRIVEFEQKGKVRAEYGESTLRRISEDLTKKFGKGFSFPQLKNIRQFYLTYSEKGYTLSNQFKQSEKGQTLSSQSNHLTPKISYYKFPLSWSHYCLLMRLDEPFKQEFYEAECIRGNWSVRLEYALGGMSNKIFASKYRLQLPDPEVLKTEVEHERQRLLETKIVNRV